MKKYSVKIKFTDGDEVNSNVFANDKADALQRVVENEKTIEFISAENKVVKNVDIAYIGEVGEIADDTDRFSIAPSQEREGWLVAVDKQNNIVLIFEQGDFNGTVECEPLDDNAPALNIATSMRELADWLNKYHSVLVDGDERKANRKRIGLLVAEARKAKKLSIRKLADLCGVSFQNVTKIENGRYNVSIDILSKICDALGYKVTITPKDE